MRPSCVVLLPLVLGACASTMPPNVATQPNVVRCTTRAYDAAAKVPSGELVPPRARQPEPQALAKVDASSTHTESTDAEGAATRVTTPPAPGSQAPQFQDRRAIEALDVLARTVPVEHDKRGAVMTFSSDELFDVGSPSLAASAHLQLDGVATALAAQSGRAITIRGYTDSFGDHVESTALSLRRAMAVRDYLVSKGAPTAQMRAEGLGPQHPVADNGTPLGRAANRRVEIIVERPIVKVATGAAH